MKSPTVVKENYYCCCNLNQPNCNRVGLYTTLPHHLPQTYKGRARTVNPQNTVTD